MLWAKIYRLEGKFVSSKKHLKMAYFGVHESGLPEFGSPECQTEPRAAHCFFYFK